MLAFARWIGFTPFVLGATDIGHTWLPLNFGNREWEFATGTASLNGMPIILLGLTLVVVASALDGRKWWALGACVVSAMLVLSVLAGTALWGTNVPLALGAVEGVAMTGLMKATLKTSVQSVVLPVILAMAAYHTFRAFKTG